MFKWEQGLGKSGRVAAMGSTGPVWVVEKPPISKGAEVSQATATGGTPALFRAAVRNLFHLESILPRL